MPRTAARAVGTFFLLLAAACGGGTGPNLPYILSDEQIRAIVPVLAVGALEPVFTTLPGQLDPLNLSAPLQYSIDRTAVCPSGGTIATTGAAGGDVAGGSGSLNLSAGETLVACGITSDTTTYSVASGPVLGVYGLVRYVAGTADNVQHLFIQGTISVVNPQGQIALCAVDLTLDATLTTRSAHVTGNLCRRGVDLSVTWGPRPQARTPDTHSLSKRITIR